MEARKETPGNVPHDDSSILRQSNSTMTVSMRQVNLNAPEAGGAVQGTASSTSVGERSWRSMFRWFSPAKPEEGAQSERILLQTFGDVQYEDQQHIRSLKVQLARQSQSSMTEDSQGNSRTINTLIIDQEDVDVPATGRNNVVVCHGFGSGLGFFYRNLSPLSRLIPNSRVYAVDWLGMGRSGRPAFPMFRPEVSDVQEAIDFFLDAFEEWRQQQPGLERFVLLGHSMGGYLAAIYALRHPERIQRLILASPVGLPEQTEAGVAVTGRRMPSWVTRLWNANYTPQGVMRGLGPFGPRMAAGYINGRFSFLPPGERQLLGNYFYHICADKPSGEYALAALLAPGAWAREPLHRRLPDLRMPCTFLYGQHDWMDKRHAEEAAQRMHDAIVHSVEGADHHLYIDNPGEFNRLVAEACQLAFTRRGDRC